MSYILDALKKSEAERSRSNGPTLLASSEQARSHSALLVWALLAVLLVNAGVMAAWLLSRSSTPVADAPNTSSPSSDALTTQAPGMPIPQPAPRSSSRAAPVPDSASSNTMQVELPADLTAANDAAPPPADDSVPQLDFTTHVYADDPAQRAVTLDGRRFAEGDALRPGITLIEITETGVVLGVDGRTVAVDVVQGWH